MQPDARFVENIKDSSQARTDLRRETNALRFSATERSALAIEREIAQPNFEQELQTRLDFSNHFRRDLLLLAGELDLGNEVGRILDRQLGKLMNVELAFLLRPSPCGRSHAIVIVA
jgi:hypothetical protein